MSVMGQLFLKDTGEERQVFPGGRLGGHPGELMGPHYAGF